MMVAALVILAACDASLVGLVGVMMWQHERMLRALSASYESVSAPVTADSGKHFSMYKSKGDD